MYAHTFSKNKKGHTLTFSTFGKSKDYSAVVFTPQKPRIDMHTASTGSITQGAVLTSELWGQQ
jgi:hypothetical protein